MTSTTAPDAFEKMEEHGIPKASEPTDVATASKQKTEEEDELPKLSAKDFKVYNRMAEHMDMFHENFRRSWNTLYAAASSNTRPQGLSIRQFLALAEQFCHHLTIHHTIEEQHIFPVLARKMAVFKSSRELIKQHEQIHEGIEKVEGWVKDVKTGEREFRLGEFKTVLDGFGGVLWSHLDEEVKTLGAENMRKYWTLQEMGRMPM